MLNLDKRDYQYLANKQVQESAMYGTTKSSYEELDKTKLIIRHKKEITPEQAGARTRHISSLFIENEAGERFKYPYAHLAGGRAMARHVANGGLPHDDFGKHIVETSSNIAKLTAFKRFVGKKDFMNTTSNDIIEGSNIELENLRTHIKKLAGQNYYSTTKENFAPVENTDAELGEDVVNELTNAFTIPQFNEDLKDLFPLLHTIHQKRVAETTVDLDAVVKEDSDIDAILAKHPEEWKQAKADGGIEYGNDLYQDLFDYFADSGEMPYGTMKARDGDPDQWIQNELESMGYFDDEPEESIFPEEEFENWADSVVDEALDKQRIAMLNKMIGKTLPVGPDATNAINSLKGIIDDEGLMNELKDLADNDTESCARPAIYRYIQKNNPEALDDLDFGDMKKEDDDTTDVTIDKDGAMKLAGDEEPKDEKASTEDIIEFVRSFYDKETGAFPKGETGVVISARKRFGDSVGDLVEKFVSKLSGNKVQVENDEDVEEGSIKYMHSLKAKGHSDEEIAKELNMSADEVKKAMSKTNEVEESRKAPAEVKKLMAGHTYTCEDCGCEMHNCKPDCDCKYDSHDEMGSWWKDENGNGIADVAESKNEDLVYIKDKLAKLIR